MFSRVPGKRGDRSAAYGSNLPFRGTGVLAARNVAPLEDELAAGHSPLLINMETITATSAIVTGDIDAAVGGSNWLGLRDQGVSRVISV